MINFEVSNLPIDIFPYSEEYLLEILGRLESISFDSVVEIQNCPSELEYALSRIGSDLFRARRVGTSFLIAKPYAEGCRSNPLNIDSELERYLIGKEEVSVQDLIKALKIEDEGEYVHSVTLGKKLSALGWKRFQVWNKGKRKRVYRMMDTTA